MNPHTQYLRRRATAWLLLALACAAPLHAADRKPNFLFIITDDQRWDAMGVVQKEQGEKARFPWFESPGMDRLAAEGVRFRNAFVTLSTLLAVPRRVSHRALQPRQRRHQQQHAFSADIGHPRHPAARRRLPHRLHRQVAHGRPAGERPGFDHAASFVGQGIYQDCPFEINGVKTPTKGWVDDVSTDFAIDWIKQNREQPFSMVVGFKSPHNKRGGDNLPARLRDLYAGETSRPVPNLNTPAIYHKPNPETGEVPARTRRQLRPPRLPPPHQGRRREPRPFVRHA